MADKTINALDVVITPASTDVFPCLPVNEAEAKKQTRAQIHALETGEKLVLPTDNTPLVPSLAWGDGDTGFYESTDDIIRMSFTGLAKWAWSAKIYGSNDPDGPAFMNEVVTATNPTVVASRNDPDTGIGSPLAGDDLSVIAGGVEAMRFTMASSAVLQMVEANVGLTADVSSAQGGGVITSSFNVYSIVGSAGDAATLPATFGIGTLVYVKNDAAANSMDVFPASGDDAGGGANTAVAVANGDFAVFMATAANATWTKIMGGTA